MDHYLSFHPGMSVALPSFLASVCRLRHGAHCRQIDSPGFSSQEKKAVLGIVAAIAVGSVVLFGFERVARDPASTSFRSVTNSNERAALDGWP